MRFIDSFRRSGRNLRRAKLRTLLTMLAISIGAFALMTALAAGEGARQFVDRLVSSNFDNHSVFVTKATGQGLSDIFGQDEVQEYKEDAPANGEFPMLTKDDLKAIAAVENVQKVVPVVQPEVEYITTSGSAKYSTAVRSIEEGVQYELLAGQLGSPQTVGASSVVLPEALLPALGFASPDAALGQKVTLQFKAGVKGPLAPKTYTIAAVAKKPTGLLGGAREVIMNQKDIESVYESQVGSDIKYISAIAFVQNNDATALAALKARFSDKGFDSLSAEELAQQVTQAVNIVQYFIAGFGVIALIVAVFGIVNTQLISVLERTRQIGLMKALGLSGGGVLKLFTFEAMWIGLGGSLIGIFTAFLVAIFANPFLNESLDLGGNLLVFSPMHVIGLTAALVVIAAVSGLLPAWKAARLNPITALRTE